MDPADAVETMAGTARAGSRPARRGDASNEVVVTFHPQATEAGLAMLADGGNAFDAFIAATLAEYVVAEGGTSLAGPLGVLVYDAGSGKVEYLDAEFNQVQSRKGQWRPGDGLGKTVLVPGAPAGLEALSRRYGRLDFAACAAPAIRLARDGFVVGDLYGGYIGLCAGKLRSTAYGRSTFFRDGEALKAGDILRQPELATLLEKLARRGAAYMYEGRWARRLVKAARATGGRIDMDDMAEYRAAWCEPWTAEYRDHTMYACSGRTYGGLWTLLGLKALEHADLRRLGHWSRSADALDLLARTVRAVWEETWLLDYRLLEDREFVTARLSAAHGERIRQRVQERTALPVRSGGGSHSYHVIVRDRDGNLASGTNTHESLAWAGGMFVDGVVVPASGYLPWGTPRGERRISPFAIVAGLQDGRLRCATGSFSSSIIEASLQFVLNLVDYRFAAAEAATLPRLGTFPHHPADFLSASADAGQARLDYASNWLDPRVPARIVSALERRGLAFVPDAAGRRRDARRAAASKARGPVPGPSGVDTGLGAVLAVDPDGLAEGAATPWPGTEPTERHPARRTVPRAKARKPRAAE